LIKFFSSVITLLIPYDKECMPMLRSWRGATSQLSATAWNQTENWQKSSEPKNTNSGPSSSSVGYC